MNQPFIPAAAPPLVSIIVLMCQDPTASGMSEPYVNEEAQIPDAILSVLSQSLSSLEILIGRDWSAEPRLFKSLTACAGADARIRLFDVPGGSPETVMLTCLAEACGRWVAFIRPEDRYLEPKLERQVSLLKLLPEKSVVLSGIQQFSLQDNRKNWLNSLSLAKVHPQSSLPVSIISTDRLLQFEPSQMSHGLTLLAPIEMFRSARSWMKKDADTAAWFVLVQMSRQGATIYATNFPDYLRESSDRFLSQKNVRS